MISVESLAALVRDYLHCADLAASPPCLHRYRGAVREREVERRRKLKHAARDRLDLVLKDIK